MESRFWTKTYVKCHTLITVDVMKFLLTKFAIITEKRRKISEKHMVYNDSHYLNVLISQIFEDGGTDVGRHSLMVCRI